MEPIDFIYESHDGVNIYARHWPVEKAKIKGIIQVAVGKFVHNHNGRLQLPVSVQVNHTVCDGYHVGQFVERLQVLANDCEEWLC